MTAGGIDPRDAKDVAQQHQTDHKLEAMSRYFGAWMTILAQKRTERPFCSDHLYVIDTHSANGAHKSDNAPDGFVHGTTMLAAHRAREVQAKFAGLTIHVRGCDIDLTKIGQLQGRLAQLRGASPFGVDALVLAQDWRTAAPGFVQEILEESHPHGGSRRGRHDHRSLWFVDPYGVEGIDSRLLAGLPEGAEVIVNLDINGFRRDAGRARNGERGLSELLDVAWGGHEWSDLPKGAPRQAIADSFGRSLASQFKRPPQWRAHLLNATGGQDRALVQFAHPDRAITVFADKFRDASRLNTILQERKLDQTRKGQAAESLHAQFAGTTVSIGEMALLQKRWNSSQLHAICLYAVTLNYGDFDGKRGEMTWVNERTPPAGLFD